MTDAATAIRALNGGNNPQGRFCLYRIGDAWASRNLNASVLDAARIAHAL